MEKICLCDAFQGAKIIFAPSSASKTAKQGRSAQHVVVPCAMGRGDGGPHSRRSSGSGSSIERLAGRSARASERGDREKSREKGRERHSRSKNAENSAGSSESGESSKGSSSRTNDSTAMVDGFALFALAIQDNLRAKLKKLKSGGDVSDKSLFSELRKLWEEMGEDQKLEWQCQANNVPSSLSGSHDSSSPPDDEDNDSQDSGTSAGDRSGSAGSYAFRKSSTPLDSHKSSSVDSHKASSGVDDGQSTAQSQPTGTGTPDVAAILERLGQAKAAAQEQWQQSEMGWHLPYAPQHLAAMRVPMADLPALHADGARQRQGLARATGLDWAQAAREAVLSSMTLEERLQIGEALVGGKSAGMPLGLLGSMGLGCNAGLEQALHEQALQMQRQQQHAAELQSFGLKGQSTTHQDLAQQILMHHRLQAAQGLQGHGLGQGLQGAASLLPLQAALQDSAARHLPSIILPMPQNGLYLQQQPARGNSLVMGAQQVSSKVL